MLLPNMHHYLMAPTMFMVFYLIHGSGMSVARPETMYVFAGCLPTTSQACQQMNELCRYGT